MIEQIAIFFSIEMIYLWLNIGIVPFWFILIFFPQSKLCNFFVASIFPFLLLGSIYAYLFYYFFNSGFEFFVNFKLYLGLYELSDLFESEAFLILFWTHFISINFFCGSWLVKDSQKFFMSKYIVSFPISLRFLLFLGAFIFPSERIYIIQSLLAYFLLCTDFSLEKVF